MDHTNRNFVSFMQTNYNTIRVSFLRDRAAAPVVAPAMPAPPQDARYGAPLAPAWAQDQTRPWAVAEESKPAAPKVHTYSYKVPKDLKLQVGDIVVVPSGDSIAFARVEIVDELPSLDFSKDVTYKWIISKIDFAQYNELVKAEAEFSRKMEAVQRMRVQQEAINTMRAQLLSNSDPVSAAMFADALKCIGATVPEALVQNQTA